jgi:calcineurin-like phosphoesterase
MLTAIFSYLSTGFTAVIGLFTNVMGGGVGIIWDGTALTDAGELLLMSSLVGLGLFAINFAVRLIPFVKR